MSSDLLDKFKNGSFLAYDLNNYKFNSKVQTIKSTPPTEYVDIPFKFGDLVEVNCLNNKILHTFFKGHVGTVVDLSGHNNFHVEFEINGKTQRKNFDSHDLKPVSAIEYMKLKKKENV